MILVSPEHLPIEADTELYDAYYRQYIKTCEGITGDPHKYRPISDENIIDNFEARDCFGVLGVSNFHFTLKKYFFEYHTLSSPVRQSLELHLKDYNQSQTVFVISWLDFTTLNWEDVHFLLNIFPGKTLVDDSFESCPIRNNAMNEMLEQRGYNTKKIGFFTNCPRKDLQTKENNFYRDNWLHLTLVTDAEARPDDKGTINYLDNKKELINYNNKKYQFLSLNGHSTATRLQVILKLHLEDVISPSKFRYSMCDLEHTPDAITYLVNQHVPQDNGDFYNGLIYRLFPKRLAGDVFEGRERDFFVSPDWWEDCYFNLNIDTNQAYLGDHWVNISEKWMKQIMFYTPGININEYTGLEQHHKDLGFKGYDKFWDHSYDTIENHYERINAVVDVIKNMKDPTESEWQEMMEIAEYNYNHLFNHHIPTLSKKLRHAIVCLINQV
jgi:hypothetical protein